MGNLETKRYLRPWVSSSNNGLEGPRQICEPVILVSCGAMNWYTAAARRESCPGVPYPSHVAPNDIHRTQEGLPSSHFTRRPLEHGSARFFKEAVDVAYLQVRHPVLTLEFPALFNFDSFEPGITLIHNVKKVEFYT